MPGDGDYCSNENCGCHIDSFPTSQECPSCGRRLRLIGRSPLLEFRLSCHNCGYQSHRLSQQELQEVL